MSRIREFKEALDRLKSEADMAERAGELDRVAEIRYGRIPKTEKSLKEAERKLSKNRTNGSILRENITEEDIASVVSKWTGIPVSKMLESETKKLREMEVEIEKRVVGQHEAVMAVSNAIRRSRAGLSEESRPIGSFIFLGMTGVGKTELARALAEFLFDDEKALIRVDMSEYMEAHSVAKFIGSPPGYVGFEEGGQLSERVRQHPYSVVLFDEIEKAHPDIFHALLQILDDGRLTDAKGRTVSFKNTIVIMTSNVGSDIFSRSTLGFHDASEQGLLGEEESRERIMAALRKTFRPEFLNRIDEVVLFHSLTRETLERVLDIQISRISDRLSLQGLSMRVTPEAREFLLAEGYDPAYGARPLKRALQNALLDPLALRLLGGDFGDGDTVRVFVSNGKLSLEKLPSGKKR